MNAKRLSIWLAASMLASTGCIAATNLQAINGGLPEVVCGPTSCSLASDLPATKSSSRYTRGLKTQAISVPAVAAHPPGQRLRWVTPTSPFCQDLGIGTPPVNSYNFNSPYSYLEADAIPVPLGSTDMSVLGSMTVNLWIAPAGSAGTYGILQVARAGTGQWLNLDTGYTLTAMGDPGDQRSMWGKGSYQGLVNLADLPGGSGVPTAVDVRLGTLNVITNLVSQVFKNQVCNGILDVTF